MSGRLTKFNFADPRKRSDVQQKDAGPQRPCSLCWTFDIKVNRMVHLSKCLACNGTGYVRAR